VLADADSFTGVRWVDVSGSLPLTQFQKEGKN
jgi:hypothetical protein